MKICISKSSKTLAAVVVALSVIGCQAEDSVLSDQEKSGLITTEENIKDEQISSELARLAIDGAIEVKAPSASAFRHTIRIGSIEHVYGKGFGLDLKTTHYNSCESHLIYDLLHNEITVTPQTYGSPSCEVISLPAPAVFKQGSAEFRDKLGELLALLKHVEGGYYNIPADARVSPVISHLENIAKKS